MGGMGSGKIRQQTNILKLRGAYKHDPKRLAQREGEPIPDGDIGEPPEYMTDAEKGAWRELVGFSHRGTLCRADRPFLEYASKLLLAIREPGCPSSALGLRWEQTLARLGMTPADRSRVQVGERKDDANPFREFA